MIGYCAEHKDQRKDAFLAAITTDCPYCRIAELEQQLADEKKAAGHWMEQSCKDHNRAEKLEQDLSRYQGAVEVEGYIAGVPTDISTELYFASGWSKELGKFSNKKVRVLVYPQADKGAVALKEVE